MSKTQLVAVAALALILAAAPVAFAAGQKASGTIVAVEEETIDIKGADGKTYEIKAAEVVAEDLKTGDIVEYEVIAGKPLNVKKKAK